MIEKADGKVFAVFKESLITFWYLAGPEDPADHVLDGPVLVRDVNKVLGLSLCRNRNKGGLSIWLVLTLVENLLISTTQNLNSTACLKETIANGQKHAYLRKAEELSSVSQDNDVDMNKLMFIAT